MVTFKPASLSLFLSAFLASSSLTNAQSLPDDIVGCKDVSCPKEKANYRCTVDQNTFLGVGLSRIPNVPRILDGISLIKGVNISNPEQSTNNTGPDPDWAKETRPFKSVYYLGTPSGLNVDDLTGCAVIFNDAPARSFSRPKEMTNLGNTTSLQAASGTCPEVIEQSCIDTLTERTRRLAVTSASGSEDACALLERELNGESFDECADLGGMNKGLGNFTVMSLSGLSTISGERNSSSDCWPVLPKSDNLAEIGEHTILGNYTVTAHRDIAYRITPILTVFLNNTLLNETNSQITCLKVVTEYDPDDGDDVSDDSENSGSLTGVSMIAVGVTLLMAVLGVGL